LKKLTLPFTLKRQWTVKIGEQQELVHRAPRLRTAEMKRLF